MVFDTVCLSTLYTCCHLLCVVYVIVSNERCNPGLLAMCLKGPGKLGKPELASRLVFMILYMWLVQTEKALAYFNES